MSIKYLSYGLMMQTYFISMIYASDSNAQQYKSVKETYIEITLDDVTIKESFEIIEAKTQYGFYYNENDLDKTVKIHFKSGNSTTVSDVLLEISSQANLKFRQVNNNISVTPIKKSKKQSSRIEVIIDDVEISGKVTDENGNGLPGVNILVKGTSTGAITDQDGQYKMKVPEGSTLVFSYIGYEAQEIEIGSRTEINVQLIPDLETLSEVVVTAFGIEREKKALSFSAQEIKGEDVLTETKEINMMNSLKGRIAGVYVNGSSGGPSGSTFVTIRGNSSLTGENQPLYVVDGVPIDNSNLRTGSDGIDYGDGIMSINPEDVESITVLKGPNASALYGSRGANGVIQVTTKKGKSRKGVGVSFSSNYTADLLNVVPKIQNVYGGGQYDDYRELTEIQFEGQTVWQWPEYQFNMAGGKYDGRPIVLEYLPDAGILDYTGGAVDRMKDFFQTGSTFTNNLAFYGGNEGINYRVSLSDLRNKGIVPNNKFNRQTIAVRINSQVSKKLSIDAKLNYVHHQDDNKPRTGSFYGFMPALYAVPSFIPYSAFSDYKYPDGSYRSWKYKPRNPYWLINELPSEGIRDRLIGFLTAKFNFTDWLYIQGRIGNDSYTDQHNEITGIGTPGRNRGSVTNYIFKINELNADALLVATGNISDSFMGSLTLGGNYRKNKNVTQGAYGKNLVVPDLYHISNAEAVYPRYDLSQKVIQSVYFLGQLSFKNMIFLDITGRNDWSSTLGLDNQSYFYPSAGLSFVITDMYENNSKILTFAKLRASWAQAGSDAGPYQTKAGYSVSTTNNFRGLTFSSLSSTLPNIDLKNELTTSLEFGADFRFFNNRLGLDFTYYDASTENQIMRIELPGPSGFNRAVVNAGEIRNKGWELTANATIFNTPSSFQWDLSLNLSRNRSKVVSLAPGIETLTLYKWLGMAIEARPGESYGNIVARKFKRNEEGRMLVNSEGGFIRTDETYIQGNVQPDFLGGLSNTFSFKGFRLSALIDIRQGGKIFSKNRREQYSRATGMFTLDRDNLIWDGVIEQDDGTYKENDIVITTADYYNMQAWRRVYENMIVDASFMALRELTLGYRFAPNVLANTPFHTIEFSVIGRNLFYIKRAKEFKEMGVSPENSFAPTAPAQGVDNYNLPTTRNIGVNLIVTF